MRLFYAELPEGIFNEIFKVHYHFVSSFKFQMSKDYSNEGTVKKQRIGGNGTLSKFYAIYFL